MVMSKVTSVSGHKVARGGGRGGGGRGGGEGVRGGGGA